MGWYAHGPNELEYKYGNVVAAAAASGVGLLGVAPRVRSAAEIDELEFLKDLQDAVERAGLPWRHLEFSDGIDTGGLFLPVALDFDPWAMLNDLSGILAKHVESVRLAYAAATGEPASFEELRISMDVLWVVPPTQVDTLFAWLNEPLAPTDRITADRLRTGSFEHRWYQPPADLATVFNQFGDADDRRYLVAIALANYAHDASDQFWLSQPDDDLGQVAWRSIGAVLYRPADHPFLDLLAEAFGVAPAVRDQVFYAFAPLGPGQEVNLPPEQDVSSEDARAGLEFAWGVGRILNVLVDTGFGTNAADGRHMSMGWHAGGSFDDIAAAFNRAGRSVHSLDDVLADHRGEKSDLPAEIRLLVLARGGAPEVAGYVLDGGEQPEPSLSAVIIMLAHLDVPDLLDLAEDQLARLRSCLHSFAAHTMASRAARRSTD
jgi:hypothetical protein